MTVNTITIVKLKFGYRFWAFSTCGKETKYSNTPLLEPYNRKTSSSLSRLISSEQFLIIFACFSKWLRVCWDKICQMHMLMTTVVFKYHCHDSNTDVILWPRPSYCSSHSFSIFCCYWVHILNLWSTKLNVNRLYNNPLSLLKWVLVIVIFNENCYKLNYITIYLHNSIQ